MDILIKNESGILDTPILTNKKKAEEVFDEMAKTLLKDEWDEVKDIKDYDEKIEMTNSLLLGTGKSIEWFTNLEEI